MEHIIDCRWIDSRAELHRVLAQVLAFPEWYGRNLDALYDLLTVIREDTYLVFQNWNPNASAFIGLKQVLEDAEATNPMLHISFRG